MSTGPQNLDVADALAFVDRARVFHRYCCTSGARAFQAFTAGFCLARQLDSEVFGRIMAMAVPRYFSEPSNGATWVSLIEACSPTRAVEMTLLYAALDAWRDVHYRDAIGVRAPGFTPDPALLRRAGVSEPTYARAFDSLVIVAGDHDQQHLFALDVAGRRRMEFSFHERRTACRWAEAMFGAPADAWTPWPAGDYNALPARLRLVPRDAPAAPRPR
jgi:hypothetical protein